RREDETALPTHELALRILEPRGRFAREADEQDVDPPVAVEVARIGEEVVGVLRGVECLGLVDLVLRLEVGARVPIRTRDHIAVAVAIEVGVARALGVELARELDAAEGEVGVSSAGGTTCECGERY